MTKWWLSNSRFTIQVNLDEDGRIVWTAPIARKFVGQPIENLLQWVPNTQIGVLHERSIDPV